MKCFLYSLTFFLVISVYADESADIDAALTTLGGVLDKNCVLKTGADLFNATLCIHTEGITNEYNEGYEPVQFFNTNKAESLLDQFDEAELKARYGNKRYDKEKSVGIFQINFRGLPMLASFPVANEPQLLFWVPDLGIKKVFKGDTRDESIEELRDYLKKGDNASRILTELSRISPVAPDVQLIEEMGRAVFDLRALSISTQLNFGWEKRAIELRGISDPFRQFLKEKEVEIKKEVESAGEIDLDYINVPWAKNIPLNAGRELISRLTFGYTKIGGAEDYRIMGGLGYKWPVDKQQKWFLSAGIDYGFEGSPDLASVAQILSPSLTSEALIWGDPQSNSWTVGMANMVGYYKSLSLLEYQGYDIEIERKNTILRNGLLFSKPLGIRLLSKELAADMYIIDTRSFGDTMYEDQYNKIGFALGFRKKISTGLFGGDEEQTVNAPQSSMMRLSVEYHHSDVSDGWGFSYSYNW